MKSKYLLFLLFLAIQSIANTALSQEIFKRIDIIPEGKCVIYAYREASLTGAAVSEYGIQIAKAGKTQFPKAKSSGFYYTYTKLMQRYYAPIVLDANTIYRIKPEGSNVPVYFSGEVGSETLFRISGASYPKYECINGTSYITRKTFIKEDFESQVISGKVELGKFKEKSNSKLLKKLKEMKLSMTISKYIYE